MLSPELAALASQALADVRRAAEAAELAGADDGWNGVRDLFGLEGTAASRQISEGARQLRKRVVQMEAQMPTLSTPDQVKAFLRSAAEDADVSVYLARAELLSARGVVDQVIKPSIAAGVELVREAGEGWMRVFRWLPYLAAGIGAIAVVGGVVAFARGWTPDAVKKAAA
jgi:hypothetical protein